MHSRFLQHAVATFCWLFLILAAANQTVRGAERRDQLHVMEFPALDSTYRHAVGRAYAAKPEDVSLPSWGATVNDGPGFISFGPYTEAVPIGTSTVTFSLAIDNNNANNDPVAWVDANDASTMVPFARRTITRADFEAPNRLQDFDLTFETRARSKIEFRVYTQGKAFIRHFGTTVRPDLVSLDKLWDGSAHFEFLKQEIFLSSLKPFSKWQTEASARNTQDASTASLVALDGKWYAFNRYTIPTPKGVCNGSMLVTVVRKSDDRGKSWSDPVPAAVPSGCVATTGAGDKLACRGGPQNPPDSCYITDGGAFFDAETDTWHLLSQCLGVSSGWAICHYTRAGSSPVGAFTADAANPVVKPNQLFSQICKGSHKHCDPRTKDEGTPQILFKRDGYFYVTFHGAITIAGAVDGVRGAARTRDFRAWETSGDDLPGDAMFSSAECANWHVKWHDGGCIGTGAASTIRSNGMFYSLAEAADESLECKKGQNWIFGLMSNSRLGPSGTWENYSDNPFVVDLSASPSGCELTYMNLFRDRGEIFLSFGLYTPTLPYPNNTYRLAPGSGKPTIIVR